MGTAIEEEGANDAGRNAPLVKSEDLGRSQVHEKSHTFLDSQR